MRLNYKIEAMVQLHFRVLAIRVLGTGSWSVETPCNKNVKIAICEITILSEPLNQDQIWIVES